MFSFSDCPEVIFWHFLQILEMDFTETTLLHRMDRTFLSWLPFILKFSPVWYLLTFTDPVNFTASQCFNDWTDKQTALILSWHIWKAEFMNILSKSTFLPLISKVHFFVWKNVTLLYNLLPLIWILQSTSQVKWLSLPLISTKSDVRYFYFTEI